MNARAPLRADAWDFTLEQARACFVESAEHTDAERDHAATVMMTGDVVDKARAEIWQNARKHGWNK